MKFVRQEAKYYHQEPGIDGVYHAIAHAAHKSYMADDKPENDREFVERLIEQGHMHPLKFGAIYMKIPFFKISPKYFNNPWAFASFHNGHWYVSTNYLYMHERELLCDLKYMCECTEYHMKHHIVDCVTSIQVYKETRTHALNPHMISSTRYCNYSKERYGGQLQCIVPADGSIADGNSYDIETATVCDVTEGIDEVSKKEIMGLCHAEQTYMDMIAAGAIPQRAARVLPQSTAAYVCMCGFERDWTHFFNLRLFGVTGAPLPETKQLAGMVYNEIYSIKQFPNG